MTRIALILGLLLAFTGCATHRTSSVAVVRRDTQNRYEIELQGAEWTAGGPCNFPQMPHRNALSHWIYTPTIKGEVSADQVLLTYERGQTDFPQSALRGSVLFTNNTMRVKFEVPNYRQDSTIDHYTSYELNGSYTLVELQK